MTSQIERQPFLLEIGSEEIPARFIPTSMRALEEKFTALLREAHLTHAELRVVATPRRLAVLCPQLAVRQPDRQETVKGPPVSVAYDESGRPTKAGEGFARKMGVELADCGRGTDARGEHLLVTRTIAGRAATVVLSELLPSLVRDLPFRKTMRWGTLDIEYARPLQWLVCLLGAEVVPFELAQITSGRETRGHRTLAGDASRELKSPLEYEATLEEIGVVVDPLLRRDRIVAQATAQLATWLEPAMLREDDALLEEVVYLCEHPTAFVGRFEEAYFALPEEVVVTALKAHQRYFAVTDPDGQRLLPCFVAVRDGGEQHLEMVRAGNERVLRARLADALFYWQFDQKHTPDDHAAALADVTWLEGFGSVRDHTRRAADLADVLWTRVPDAAAEIPESLQRAAALSRFDLVTEMIKDGKEFTKLEGVIAARYAAAAGEGPEVCRILADSLLPRSAQDGLPEDRQAMVLSAAWRLDTLAGCWLAGFAPTGAKDPYALRRHALAILRILVALEARVDLREIVSRALAAHADHTTGRDLEESSREVLEFFAVRFAGWLQDSHDLDLAVVRAVLPVWGHDPADALAWVEALAGFRRRDDFLLLARGFKRCANILKTDTLPPGERSGAKGRWQEGGRGAAGEDLSALTEPAACALRDAIAAAVADLFAAESAGEYGAVFGILSSFGPLIDRLFDEVRVNVDDLALRALRLAFLREIHALFLCYADFSQVAPDDD